MKKRLAIILACTAMACTKPEPEQFVQLAPQFNLEGTIDGEEMNMTPGENGFYLYTDVVDYGSGRFHFSAQSILLNSFEGNSLTFELILDGDDNSSSEDLLDALQPGEIDLTSSNGGLFDVLFEAEAAGGDFVWSTNGGANQTGNEFVYSTLLGLDPLTCTYTDGGCVSVVTIDPVGFLACSSRPNIGVINFERNGTEAIFTPPFFTEQYLFMQWIVNGEEFTTSGNEPLVLPNDESLFFGLTLIGFDFSLSPILLSQTFSASGLECDFPQIDAGVISNEPPFMRVQFRDEMGQLFTSDLICDPDTEQPADAFFEVLSMEDFGPNENGLPTKRMEFSTKVLLKSNIGDPLGETILLEIENGSIAYPFEE